MGTAPELLVEGRDAHGQLFSMRDRRCVRAPCRSGSEGQGGYGYLGLLAFIALFGLALSAAAVVWTTATQRDREEELLFVGEQFRAAIARYRERNQTQADRLPRELTDLLQDDTQVPTQRYLRKLFVDPMTGTREWGLVRAPGGGIMGVYSTSKKAPLRKARFPSGLAEFAEAKRYSDWRFVVQEQGADEKAPGQRRAGGLRLPGDEDGQSPRVPGSTPIVPSGELNRPSTMAPVPVPVARPHQMGEPDQDAGPAGDEEGEPEDLSAPDLPSPDDGSMAAPAPGEPAPPLR